jgi:phage-related protein
MQKQIIYRGKSNLAFDLFWDVGTDFELGTPTPNVEQTDVPGVSGTQLDFNNSYKSFTQKFAFYAASRNQSVNDLKSAVTTWLLKDIGYHKLMIDTDPDYFYLAAPDPDSVMKWPAYNKHMARVEITFMIMPFKYRLDGQRELPLGNLTNPTQWPAYPLIHVVGSGDMVLTINGQEYQLNGIDDEIYLDCAPDKRLAYHDLFTNGSRGRNVVFPDHEFPVLNPGQNTLSINTGTATIIPRWRTIC